MADKPKKKRSEKTDAQLAADHLGKTAHYIDQVGNWMAKLTKGCASRKHPLTDAQKQKAAKAVGEIYDAFLASLSAKEVVHETGFKF